MMRIAHIVNDVIRLPRRSLGEGGAKQGGKKEDRMLRIRKKRAPSLFALALRLAVSQVCRPTLRLMRLRPIFCAVFASVGARLHAQSTGIFWNGRNLVLMIERCAAPSLLHFRRGGSI
jgi:hypothetical protein